MNRVLDEVMDPLTPRVADVLVYDSALTIVEVSVTNPCQGISQSDIAAGRVANNSAEQRGKDKHSKYLKDRIIDGSSRLFVPFIIEFFGRLHPAAYKYIRDLCFSSPQGGKGQAGAALRMLWFRKISCTLQRRHAIAFKRNLGIARAEYKPSKTVLPDLDDVCYVKVGGGRGFYGSHECD